jgi:DNA repair exonuclease SbcCD ATPase subunit
VDIDEIAAELYGLPPEEFIAARAARSKEARSAGNRELATKVAALRKPTVAAWATNQLVREHEDEIGLLLDLGEELRAGMQGLTGDELRTLTRRRHALVAALLSQAQALAEASGRRLAPDAVGGVRASLEATLADQGSADALRVGVLAEPLEVAGFGFGDFGTMPALPPEPSVDEGATVADLAAHREKKAEAVRAAEADVAAAEKVHSAAVEQVEEATEKAARAQQKVDDAEAAVARLEAELGRARSELEKQANKAAKRESKQAEAQAQAEDAAEALDDARTRLDHLTQ